MEIEIGTAIVNVTVQNARRYGSNFSTSWFIMQGQANPEVNMIDIKTKLEIVLYKGYSSSAFFKLPFKNRDILVVYIVQSVSSKNGKFLIFNTFTK